MPRRTHSEESSSASARQAAPGSSARPTSDDEREESPEHAGGRWTFLTNHAHVLILLAQHPSIILREVAAIIGITERAVQKIIADLEGEGFIDREKVGRQNHYQINRDRHLRHPVERHRTIDDLLRILDESR